MTRRELAFGFVSGLTIALIVTVAVPTETLAANKTRQASKKPIRNPKFDPSAEQVDLFEAVDAGQVTVKLIPKSAAGGNVFIENKTNKPITVKIPEAVAAVSIHAQVGNVGAANGGFGNLGLANPGGKNPGGAPQNLGGGIGPAANNNGQPFGDLIKGQGQGPAQNFFSIPAERVISVYFNSACLEHGKPEPSANSKYTLIPVTQISRDPVLYQLLAVIGTGKVDQKTSQAAAWHIANKMSFQTLAEKTTTPLGAITQTPDFTHEQLLAAEQLVDQAKIRVADANLSEVEESSSN